AAGGVVDLLVDRLEEMPRLEKIGDAIERLVVDQDGAQERLLRLDVVRGDRVRCFGLFCLYTGSRIKLCHGLWSGRPIGRKGGQAGAWPKERQLALRRRFGATFWVRCPRYPPTEKDVDMSPIGLDQDAVARCALDRLIRIPIGAGLCDSCTQAAAQDGLVQRACDWSATRPGIRRDHAWTGLPVPGTLFRAFQSCPRGRCRRWHGMGSKIMVDLQCKLGRLGQHMFRGELAESLRAARGRR